MMMMELVVVVVVTVEVVVEEEEVVLLTQLNGGRLSAHRQVVQRLLAIVRRSALVHLGARHHQHCRRYTTQHTLVPKPQVAQIVERSKVVTSLWILFNI